MAMMDRSELDRRVACILVRWHMRSFDSELAALDVIEMVELIVNNMAGLDTAPSEHLVDHELPWSGRGPPPPKPDPPVPKAAEELGTNARRWARAFCYRFGGCSAEIDEELMISWFAKAIEMGRAGGKLSARISMASVVSKCVNCRWWSPLVAWQGTDAWDGSRECTHPGSQMASQHPATPNHHGPPTTLPGFGCNQWTART